MTTLPPTLEGSHGATLFSTWMVVMREDWDFLETVWSKQAPPSKRAFEAVLTLNHEAVHFIQSFTTSLAYSYSLRLLALCRDLMQEARDGRLTAATLNERRAHYRKLQGILTDKVDGVSALELLEAVAVTEAFRATSADSSAAAFQQHLATYHPDPESIYRRVADIVRGRFGQQAALDLTPLLCFSALNCDEPAKWFWYLVEGLQSLSAAELAGVDAHQVAAVVGMEPEKWLPRQSGMLEEQHVVHPLLFPYFALLAEGGSSREVYEFAARPGKLLGSAKPPDWLTMLTPPVILCSGGRGKLLGRGKQWTHDEKFAFLDTAALVGACERLLADGRPYQSCPHSECQVHESALCHSWYAVPFQIPWTSCAFPKRLAVQFDAEPAQLMKVRAAAGGVD